MITIDRSFLKRVINTFLFVLSNAAGRGFEAQATNESKKEFVLEESISVFVCRHLAS